MGNVTLQATPIFYKNLNSKAQIVINRGGARSSKSHSILQLMLYKASQEKNKKILILRKTLPALRISTLLMFKEMTSTNGMDKHIREEKQNLNYWFGNNLIHFGSLDDVEKIKSTEWNYIWVEEATEFTHTEVMQLKLRLSAPSTDGKRNQMFLSFNPIDIYHWIKEKLLDPGTEDCEEIISTHKDNPFLSADYRKTLEDLINQDINFHRIYAAGEWGILEALIYSGWEIVDVAPYTDDVIYGLDFGFNNPSSLIKLSLVDDIIYEEELLYQSGLTNSDLIDKLKTLIIDKDAPIYADSAEADRIEEIYRAGFNVYPAQKGPGSVKNGIDFVKRQKIKVLSNSVNLIKEKRSYSWRTDKTGKRLEEPVKFNDHLLDAERYAIHTHLKDNITDINVKQQSYINEDSRVFAGANAW